MPRREAEPLKRLHIHIFQSDYDRLRDLYGETIGVNAAVRKMVRGSIKRMEEKAAASRRQGISVDDAGIQRILEGADA